MAKYNIRGGMGLRNSAAAGLGGTGQPDDVDHQAEIDRITTAMQKHPSGDAKITASQMDRIAHHKAQLNK